MRVRRIEKKESQIEIRKIPVETVLHIEKKVHHKRKKALRTRKPIPSPERTNQKASTAYLELHTGSTVTRRTFQALRIEKKALRTVKKAILRTCC